jgi:hypothetical protein
LSESGDGRADQALTQVIAASSAPVEELASVEHLEVADLGLEHVAVAGDPRPFGGVRQGDEVVVVRVAGR